MKALLLIDFQNDFDAFGTLAVPEAASILAQAKIALQDPNYAIKIASQNWIPAEHPMFAANHYFRYPKQVIEIEGKPQHLWPFYGVQDSFGADWMAGFPVEEMDLILQKGWSATAPPYSCFTSASSVDLQEYLAQKQVTELVIGGFLTEFAVRSTAMDALTLGYNVAVLTALCGAANLESEMDGSILLKDMETVGVELIY